MRATEAAEGFVDLSFVSIGFEDAHPELVPGYRQHMGIFTSSIDCLLKEAAKSKKDSTLRLKMSI